MKLVCKSAEVVFGILISHLYCEEHCQYLLLALHRRQLNWIQKLLAPQSIHHGWARWCHRYIKIYRDTSINNSSVVFCVGFSDVYKPHLLVLRLDLGPKRSLPDNIDRFVTVEFCIPDASVSKTQVRSMSFRRTSPAPSRCFENDDSGPQKTIRHLTKYEYSDRNDHSRREFVEISCGRPLGIAGQSTSSRRQRFGSANEWRLEKKRRFADWHSIWLRSWVFGIVHRLTMLASHFEFWKIFWTLHTPSSSVSKWTKIRNA